MQFRDIPGHEEEKRHLVSMVDRKALPHALLLEGPAGVGKLAIARAMATYIHCQNRTPQGDSCGECPECLRHAHHNHVDTIFSYPVIKKNDRPISDDFINDWNNFIDEGSPYADIERWSVILNRSKTNTKPVIYVSESQELTHKLSLTAKNSDYKVVVMWLPERLNESAANKLLKLLEEPFADTIFLLVSNDSKKILPTIYSRLQRIEFKKLPDPIVAQWLVDNYNMVATDASAIAHLAEGNMITAHELLSSNSSRHQHFEQFKSLMRLAYQRDVAKLREWSNDLAAETRDRQISFYEMAMRQVRENFIYNFNHPELVYLDTEEEAFSRNFARFISERNVEQLMATFQQARDDIFANANSKIVNFDVAIQTIFHIKNSQ